MNVMDERVPQSNIDGRKGINSKIPIEGYSGTGSGKFPASVYDSQIPYNDVNYYNPKWNPYGTDRIKGALDYLNALSLENHWNELEKICDFYSKQDALDIYPMYRDVGGAWHSPPEMQDMIRNEGYYKESKAFRNANRNTRLKSGQLLQPHTQHYLRYDDKGNVKPYQYREVSELGDRYIMSTVKPILRPHNQQQQELRANLRRPNSLQPWSYKGNDVDWMGRYFQEKDPYRATGGAGKALGAMALMAGLGYAANPNTVQAQEYNEEPYYDATDGWMY